MTDEAPESLAARLTTRGVHPSVIPHAMRYFVSASTDDLPPDEMRERLEAAFGRETVDNAIGVLARDPVALEQASLALLSSGWGDPRTHELAAGAIDAACAKLPVVELGLISIVGVYGLWILATRGRRSQHKVVHHQADGSWTEETTTTWYGPADPLTAIVQMMSAGATGIEPPERAGGTGEPSSPVESTTPSSELGPPH